jgi:transcriptional regulator with XRE-family HTH domain
MKLVLNIPKVREYMKFKEWDEKALAKEMGVSYETVYRVFRGQRNPGNEFIAKIINTCKGAEFEQLFIFENSLPNGNSNDSDEIESTI